jgi:TPR repeat protein
MKINLLLLFFVIFISGNLFAQKKGKPDLKPYKDEMKRAKKGDAASMMKIADVCKGEMMQADEIKDYKKAVEWYSRVASQTENQQLQTLAKYRLFQLYMLGGYGIGQDINLAKSNLEQILGQTDLRMIYDDKPNLDLKNFFDIYLKAQGADTDATVIEAKILLARYFFEYEIGYNAALQWLAKALIAKENADASYLDEKWRTLFSVYRYSGEKEMTKNRLFDLLQKYVEKGSILAKVERLAESGKTTLTQYKYSQQSANQLVETVNTSLLTPEMRLKMYYWLQKHEKGIPHYVTLRKVAIGAGGLDSASTVFAKDAVDEFNVFITKIQTLEGFMLACLEYPSLKGLITTNLDLYKANFEGNIQPLIAFYRELQKPEIKTLAGEILYAKYNQQFIQKVTFVIDAAESPRKLLDIQKELDANAWLKKEYTLQQEKIAKRLENMGIDSTNQDFFYEMAAAEETKFKTFEQGRYYLNNLDRKFITNNTKNTKNKKLQATSTATTPPPNPNIMSREMMKARLLAYTRNKIVTDVIGENPTREQIQRHKQTLLEPWLQPEGMNKYFYYTSDSKFWFSGEIKRHNVLYFYELVKNTGTDSYTLTIKSVVNNNAYLAFSSTVKASADTQNGVINVNIYNARYKGYQWLKSDVEYLRVNYDRVSPQISYSPVGGLSQFEDKNHGYSTDFPAKKLNTREFSEKTAIKTAVQCFILEYNRALLNSYN